MPLPYSEVVYIAPWFFSLVLFPQRSFTTTSFFTGDSLNNQASSAGLCQAVSDISHSPSEKITEGLYLVTKSLNCGIICSVTYFFRLCNHKGLNHSYKE